MTSCLDCNESITHKSSRSSRTVHRVLLALLTVSIIAACILFATLYASSSFAEVNFLGKFESNAPLGIYNRAAVTTDGPGCAKYGRQLLERNGTAMDALISVLLCMGVTIPESLGLGGGVFMVYYKKDEGKAWVIDGRETAPAAATENMFVDNPSDSLRGPRALGVPGELAAYWRGHSEFGNLKWSELFEGAIDIATKGFPMHDHLYEAYRGSVYVKNGTSLKTLFTNPATGQLYKLKEIMKRPDLVETFKKLASTDVNEFYQGSMGKTLVKEIQDLGGIVTEQDFADYRVNFYESVNISLPNGYRLYSVDPPGSGPLLGFILNVFLRLGKLEPHVGQSLEDSTLYYHRFIETFKHAYAARTKLEDRSFGRVEEMLKKLSSSEYVQSIVSKINDERTYPLSHYGSVSITEDHGTSHVSVIDQSGNAAAASSTINAYFGSGVLSPSTGIIFNDEMDDFSSPNITNDYGVAPSDLNHIEPGKRPYSSMCPSIIVDDQGQVIMAIGASGGTQITTSVALTIVRSLYLGENIKQTIDAPRIHHQFSPNVIKYEPGFPNNLLSELRDRGHDTKVISGRSSVVMGIIRNSAGQWTANSDYRKGGSIDGF